jgi:hypothetical protein
MKIYAAFVGGNSIFTNPFLRVPASQKKKKLAMAAKAMQCLGRG